MASTVRQRKTFAFSDDGDKELDDNLILDEQEQENVINDLRQAARQSNEQTVWVISGVLGMGIALQLYFLSMLLNGSHRTPFTPILDTFLDPKPLIPLSIPLTLTHIAIHTLDIICLLPPLSHLQKSVPSDVLRYAPLTTCIAPVVAMLSGRDVAQLMWWSVPAEVSALVWVSRGWMAGAVEEVTGLERLRYDVKGA
ncbi:hypothetical protein BDV93DRAFT_520456 [Ceratobasidium sp. AG-I]|nr:hypothetical protein BDV93DRAFT_520456 [Ceratobasidium sp. AG-I]